MYRNLRQLAEYTSFCIPLCAPWLPEILISAWIEEYKADEARAYPDQYAGKVLPLLFLKR